MNIKKLEKATKILQKIQSLDAEIIKIEALAMQAANDDIEVELSLGIEELKKKEGEAKVSFDEDGSLSYGQDMTGFRGFFSYIQPFRTTEQTTKKTEWKESLTNNLALQIFGVLLYDKQTKRTQLIKRLESMGVHEAL